MQHNIKKEKPELNILSTNLNSKKNFNHKSSNVVARPDTLEIRVKPDSISNILTKPNMCNDNVNWCSDNFDNFITHLKNVNNTPSPITPNSFFNPSDVTQEQEQFADTLTVHLNKIKEEYKSSIESTETSYLNNVIQISSINEDRPMQIATVSVGNKVYLVNQLNPTTIDDSGNGQCVNYGLIDLPGNVALQQQQQPHEAVINPGSNTIILQKTQPNLSQQIKISNIASLRQQQCIPSLVFSSPSVQQHQYTMPPRNTQPLPINTEMPHAQNGELRSTPTVITTEAMPNNNTRDLLLQQLDQQQQQPTINFIKSVDGVYYTRIPDSSQTQLLNHLNNISSTTNVTSRTGNNGGGGSQLQQQLVKPVIKLESLLGGPIHALQQQQQADNRCMSVNSTATESSCGVTSSHLLNNHSAVNNNQVSQSKDNGLNKLDNLKEESEIMDDQQRRLERKRARNRDAARKCRDRKNSLIMTLEQKYAKQCEEKELIREKLLKSLDEIRRLTDYISNHDPNSKFSSFSNFLQEIKIHELTDTDLKDLNLL